MTPMVATACAVCKRDLRVEYDHEPPNPRCIHRVMREHVGEDACPKCEANRRRLFERWKQMPPVCEECAAKEEAQAVVREEQTKLAARAQLSAMPVDLQGYRWDQLVRSGEREVAIVAAIQWASAPASEARGIYLWGPTGPGKTRLAATAAWHRLKAEGTALRWVSVAVLLARLEGSFSDQERQQALATLTGDCPLVLDDIDKVNASESKRAQLFAAIDRRVTCRS